METNVVEKKVVAEKNSLGHRTTSSAAKIDAYILEQTDAKECTAKKVAEALGIKQSRVQAHLYHLRTKRTNVMEYKDGLYRMV